MMRRRACGLASLAVLAMLSWACTPPLGVLVEGVQPSSGPAGTSVTVSGRIPVDAVVSLCGVALEDFHVSVDERTTIAPGLTVRGAAGSSATGRVPALPGGVCVLVVDHAGVSLTSPVSFVVVETAEPPAVPLAPVVLNATPGDGVIELAFTLDPSAPVTGVEYRLDEGAWVAAGVTSPLTIAGLVNWRSYQVELRAVNDAGVGPSRSASVMPKAPFTMVATGQNHTIALDEQGRAWAWGSGFFGQLGDGSTTNRRTPVVVELPSNAHGASRFTSIGAGGNHSVALDDQGRAWTWGSNSHGQLGDGSTTSRLTPILVEVPTNANGATRFTRIDGGGNFTVALDDQGRAWTWGSNFFGQIGDGSTTNRLTPVVIEVPSNAHGATRFTRIDGGGNFTVALDDQGRAWTWGWNFYGQLGDGSTTDRLTPVLVELPTNTHGASRYARIHAGQLHTVALDDQGRAWAWGSNVLGQLGDGSTTNRRTPVLVELPSNAHGVQRLAVINAGGNHTLALDDQGGAWTWGSNIYGQLGDGSTTDRLTPVLVELPTNSHGAQQVTSLAAGLWHTVALDDLGHAWSWGDNVLGQLGDGSESNHATPVRVAMPGGSNDP